MYCQRSGRTFHQKESDMISQGYYGVGLRRVSNVVGYSLSSDYYQSKLNDTAIIKKLNRISRKEAK